MTEDVQAFESLAWLTVLFLSVLVAALSYETRPEAKREHDKDDGFRW